MTANQAARFACSTVLPVSPAMASSPCSIAPTDSSVPAPIRPPSSPALTPAQDKLDLWQERGSVCSTSSDRTLVQNATPPCKGPLETSKKVVAPQRHWFNPSKGNSCRTKRPPNAFMLFRSWFLKSEQLPHITQMSHASQILGAVWHNLPANERREWHSLATATARFHAAGTSACFGGGLDAVNPPSPDPSEQLSLKTPPRSRSERGPALQVPKSLQMRTLDYAAQALRELGRGGAALQRVKDARSQTRRMRRARLEGAQEDIARLEARQRNRIARQQTKQRDEQQNGIPAALAPFIGTAGQPTFANEPLAMNIGDLDTLPAVSPDAEILPDPLQRSEGELAVNSLDVPFPFPHPVAPSMLMPPTDPCGLWPAEVPDVQTTFIQPTSAPTNTIQASSSSCISPLSLLVVPSNGPLFDLNLFAHNETAVPAFSNGGVLDDAIFKDMLSDCGAELMFTPCPANMADGPHTDAPLVDSSLYNDGATFTNPCRATATPMSTSQSPTTTSLFPADWDFYHGHDLHTVPPLDRIFQDHHELLPFKANSASLSPLTFDTILGA